MPAIPSSAEAVRAAHNPRGTAGDDPVDDREHQPSEKRGRIDDGPVAPGHAVPPVEPLAGDQDQEHGSQLERDQGTEAWVSPHDQRADQAEHEHGREPDQAACRAEQQAGQTLPPGALPQVGGPRLRKRDAARYHALPEGERVAEVVVVVRRPSRPARPTGKADWRCDRTSPWRASWGRYRMEGGLGIG